MVVHVIINVNKLVCQSLKNVHVPPGLRPPVVKVDLHDNLVDLIEEFDRKVLESKVLAPVGIHLHHNAFPHKLPTLQDVP